MPSILNIEQCQYNRITYYFDSEVFPYAIEGTYDWLLLTFIGSDPEPPFTSHYSLTVYENAPIGSHIIELSPGLDYITIVVTDCSITAQVCQFSSGTVGPVPEPPDAEGWDALISPAGGEITFDSEAQTLTYFFPETGTYYLTLVSQGDITIQQAYVFVVTNCYVDACEPDDSDYLLRIVWLNPTGGWSSYLFNQKKTYGVDIGGSRVFKNSDRETHYIQHDNIFDSVVQPSGLIPESHVDFLKSLKYSIAAFVYDGASGDDITYLPIFNYAKSFELKKQSNGFYKYDFEFSYSAEIITQTR